MDAIIKSLAFDPRVFGGQILLFLALWFLMNTLFWQPYLRHFAARTQGLVDAHNTRDRLQSDMESLRAEYLTRIAQVEGEARTRIQTAVKEAQTERERLIKEARDLSDSTLRQGVADLEREKQASLVAMHPAMVSLAVDAAGKALGSASDPATLRRSVEQNLATTNAGA